MTGRKWSPDELVTDPERMLILAMLDTAIKDASGNFQGTIVKDKDGTINKAKRYIGTNDFERWCEFVGGDAGVIRKRVNSPA